MALLTIIIVLVVLWASRNGRLKVVLTPEEAKAIRERWSRTAWVELKAWVLCFALGYALAADTLAREHWHWSIYALIVWCSLLLFSRLAIWVTLASVAVLFAVGSVAKVLLNHTIQPPPFLGPLLIAVVFAIIIRAVFFLSLRQPGTTISKPQPEPTLESPDPSLKHQTPDYEWVTDTWRYENGNREPANIRYPKYEGRPENRNRV
jgi:hypothetical protein